MRSTQTEKRYYSDVFKLSIIQEVVQKKLTKEQARRKYGIKGKSAILNWMRKLGFADHTKQPMSINEKKKDLRIKELEEQLLLQTIRAEGYSIMIDIAEKELKVPIRKKPPTKQ